MIENNRNNEQIYGRNDMIMLDQNNKIYGSLGIADKYVMKTEEGTRLILSNPKQGRFGDVLTEFNMYGRSEQESTTGANLIDVDSMLNDCFVKNEDETYSILKTETDRFSKSFPVNIKTGTVVRFDADIIEYNGTYKNKLQMNFYGGQSMSVGESKVFDVDLTECSIYQDNSNSIGTYTKFKNAILSVGDTQIPYEPYTGGKPSPSPDYPQEIKSVVNPTVKVCGKNLLDCRSALSRTVGGISFINNKDGSFSIGGKNTLSYNAYDIEFMVSQSGTYKAYRGTNSPIPIIIIYDPEARENVAVITDSGETFQLKKGKLYYYSIAFTDVSSDIDVTYKPFLTVDVTGTYADYEPYTGQSITLPYTLNAIPVSSGGNVTINGQQYIADYVDVERGKLVKKLKSFTAIDIKTLYTWGVNENADNVTGFYFYMKENGFPKGDNDVMASTILRYDNNTWGGKTVGCSMNVDSYNDGYAILNVPTHKLEDISSDKNACASFLKICENTNAIFFYSMASPVETDLAPEEIEQYKKLSIRTPTTIVENNYNTWMKATYKSTESV
nr:MAG TPA: hypothetical protein [Caudoviricetes sp.]